MQELTLDPSIPLPTYYHHLTPGRRQKNNRMHACGRSVLNTVRISLDGLRRRSGDQHALGCFYYAEREYRTQDVLIKNIQIWPKIEAGLPFFIYLF